MCPYKKKIFKKKKQANTDKVVVRQVNIKTPEFMKTAVNRWFSIVEAQFYFRNATTNNTKF